MYYTGRECFLGLLGVISFMTEKVKVVTLGCEKNLVDSEIMSGLIHGRGFQLVENKEEATVIIVNTCGFIDAAKEESVNTILDMAELKQSANLKALIVSGCLTQRYKQQLMEEMPEIDGIVGQVISIKLIIL